eukprot:CAMPEP_0185583174 /NCGR_PEP_ID=MMETSP0434-20130131/21364_1 /TAXON_ID=626734 ORGANISM="Favella taraikaensis, Strain Fe Narragansett Bay" /NCGR_SAMPLE_ID=MMETSP0434 /ASSEMBLY_ACC=CAM_ASM_000379 /LENGTH=119 /DNA_ID=CAMNT_0028202185 /DNA_START=85 /DNA_END=445 /DNA_ORIENTATION=-
MVLGGGSSLDLVVFDEPTVVAVGLPRHSQLLLALHLIVHMINVDGIDSGAAETNLVPLCDPALRGYHDGDHANEVLSALRAVIAVGAAAALPPQDSCMMSLQLTQAEQPRKSFGTYLSS